MSNRNQVISIALLLAALWFTTDFAVDLGNALGNHQGALILWGIVATIVYHLRDE
jgi:predicted membrane protein